MESRSSRQQTQGNRSGGRKQRQSSNQPQQSKGLARTKLILGILMIVISIFILLQSFIAGLGNTLSQNGEVSGTSGVLTALIYLAAGIVYIVTQNSQKFGGDIAGFVLLTISFLLSITNAGSFADLRLWVWVGLIIGLLFFVWHGHLLSTKPLLRSVWFWVALGVFLLALLLSATTKKSTAIEATAITPFLCSVQSIF